MQEVVDEPTHTYDVRPGLGTRRRYFRLDEFAIASRCDGETTRIDYADVVRVRLNGVGGRLGCRIEGRRGGRLDLDSHEYVSFGEFESRAIPFAEFLATFHERLRPHASSIAFERGARGLFWVAALGAVLCALLLVLLPIGVVLRNKPVDLELLGIALPVPVVGFACWSLARASRPGRYSVDDWRRNQA